MAWGAAFLAALSSRAFTPRFRLRRVLFGSEAGDSITLSSESGSPRIVRVRVDGQEINPYTLSVTWGRVVVELIGDDLGGLRTKIARGTFFELLCGSENMAEADFERIAIGGVTSLRRNAGPAWSLELLDLPATLRQRPTSTAAETQLFWPIHTGASGSANSLTSNYTAGDATINVGTTSGATYAQTSGYIGLLVTPTSGDPFYVLATGSTGTTYTGCIANEMGTTDTNAVTGDQVFNVAYLSGHPISIALRILTSRGAGANGSYDDYPASWGLGVPIGMVDTTDAEAYRDTVSVPGGGAWVAQQAILEPAEDGMSWLIQWLASSGHYLAMRQGRVTVRAWQSSATPVATPVTEWVITDADVVAFVSHEWWYEQQDGEHRGLGVVTYSTSASVSSTYVYHRPIADAAVYDMSAFVFSNESNIATEVLGRMTEASNRTPEHITLRLRGYQWSAMAVGDIARITSTVLQSRLETGGLAGRRCVVTKVSATWGEAPVTEVSLLVYPVAGDTWS
jgi:hypothetical protein